MGSPSRSNHSNPKRRTNGGAIHDAGAQQTLSDESEDKPEKVFISYHYDGDRSKVALLQHQAENSEALHVKDVSLKEEAKSNNWKPEAKKQIAESDQLVVAVGKKTAGREAVKWEIMEAMRQGKPVVVVRLNGDDDDPLPQSVKEKGTVTWNLEDIQSEIDKNRKKRNKSKGNKERGNQ